MGYTTTIVIPNYNGLQFMKPCLESLERQRCRDFQVLVIDNGSTDGSARWLSDYEESGGGRLRGFGPGSFRVILSPVNTGFSGAVNMGIRESRTPYIILLNNDLTADPDYVGEMVRAVSASDRIFSVSCRMLQMYRPELMDDAGDMYSVMGWAYQRGVGQPAGRYNRPFRVFSACAGAAIYRRAVFREIGLFDEMHFAYLEDIDVGYRARLRGYDNIYCPTARVWHVGSGTSGSKYNSFKVKLAARNNIYLNWKNMPGWQLALNALPIAAGMMVKWAFFQKIGYGRDYAAGVREGISTLHRCRRVDFAGIPVKNLLFIQADLIFGTMLYCWEFLVRRLNAGSGAGSKRVKESNHE